MQANIISTDQGKLASTPLHLLTNTTNSHKLKCTLILEFPLSPVAIFIKPQTMRHGGVIDATCACNRFTIVVDSFDDKNQFKSETSQFPAFKVLCCTLTTYGATVGTKNMPQGQVLLEATQPEIIKCL